MAGWDFSSHGRRQASIEGWQDLEKIFNQGLNVGKTEIGAGETASNQAQNFFSTLASGDRAAIERAIGPSVSALTGEAQQEKNTLAEFGGGRSGGTNAEIQALGERTSGEITNMINSLLVGSNQELATIGAERTGAGLTGLNIASGPANSLADWAIHNTDQATAARQAQQSAIGQMIGSLLGPAFGNIGTLIGSLIPHPAPTASPGF